MDVVAGRPGANPSPGECFHHFWDSVSRHLFIRPFEAIKEVDAAALKGARAILIDNGARLAASSLKEAEGALGSRENPS